MYMYIYAYRVLVIRQQPTAAAVVEVYLFVLYDNTYCKITQPRTNFRADCLEIMHV